MLELWSSFCCSWLDEEYIEIYICYIRRILKYIWKFKIFSFNEINFLIQKKSKENLNDRLTPDLTTRYASNIEYCSWKLKSILYNFDIWLKPLTTSYFVCIVHTFLFHILAKLLYIVKFNFLKAIQIYTLICVPIFICMNKLDALRLFSDSRTSRTTFTNITNVRLKTKKLNIRIQAKKIVIAAILLYMTATIEAQSRLIYLSDVFIIFMMLLR